MSLTNVVRQGAFFASYPEDSDSQLFDSLALYLKTNEICNQEPEPFYRDCRDRSARTRTAHCCCRCRTGSRVEGVVLKPALHDDKNDIKDPSAFSKNNHAVAMMYVRYVEQYTKNKWMLDIRNQRSIQEQRITEMHTFLDGIKWLSVLALHIKSV